MLKSNKQLSLCKFTFKKLNKLADFTNFLAFFLFLFQKISLLDPDQHSIWMRIRIHSPCSRFDCKTDPTFLGASERNPTSFRRWYVSGSAWRMLIRNQEAKSRVKWAKIRLKTWRRNHQIKFCKNYKTNLIFPR